jgi:thiol reductant ABC exporter CydD subunit
VALGVASALIVVAQATAIAAVAARGFDGAALAAVGAGVVLVAGLAALRGACAWGFEVAGRRAAGDVLSGLRLELVERRLRHRPAALDGAQSAELAATAVQGVDALEAYFARYLPQVVLAMIVPVVVVAWALAIDPIAGLLMLVTLPLVPLFMVLVGVYTDRRTRRRWLALTALAASFADAVRGLPTLRAFNRSAGEAQALAHRSDEYRQATLGTLRVTFLSGAVLDLAATLGVALVAVAVGLRLVSGDLALQPGLTVLILAPEVYLPLRALGAQYHASADGLAVADRLLGLIGEPALPPTGQAAPPRPDHAPVRLERVTFAYPARAGAVLEELDLELAPRATTALVGPSGAGKSTVASLLLRFADPLEGRVTVGGVDLAQCDPALWRRSIAWVPQRPTLFRGTVAENIALGAPAAGEDRIRAAARAAGAHEFIERLQDGYVTLVGDGGAGLSAGETRRLALARAFAREAPLLILDEPTADLDRESAQIIERAVAQLAGAVTILLVAHDTEFVRQADHVVCLAAGRVVGGAMEPHRMRAALGRAVAQAAR